MWCNYESPVEKRAVNSFLFGLRHQLINKWKIPPKYIKIDKGVPVLKAGGREVVRVTVKGVEVVPQWLDQEWENWDELKGSQEFKDIVQKASEKLKASWEDGSKGAGKGQQ